MTKLQQILQNLLSNAIKFTPEGGRVVLKAEADTKYVTISVMDTGVGIAKEEQDLIFQKFRQSGNPLTREHAGTGLGLSIVRELCKLLGGEVTLQSELGRGSTFTVRLPMQLSEEPRLEFDLAAEQIDLARAQRVDARVYAGGITKVERHEATMLETVGQGRADAERLIDLAFTRLPVAGNLFARFGRIAVISEPKGTHLHLPRRSRNKSAQGNAPGTAGGG